jgi:hypothetical protein
VFVEVNIGGFFFENNGWFVSPVPGQEDVVCTGKGQGNGFREQMKKELKSQVVAIEGLKGKASSASPEFTAWRRETEEILAAVFGQDSAEVQEFNAIYYTPVFLTCRMGDEAFDEAYRGGLEEARKFLMSMMDKIRRPA